MEMDFKYMLEKLILVHLDDIIVYSKNALDHFGHLGKVFIKSGDFSVSLNLRKCVFATSRGKLLQHIILGDGLTIDLERVK